MEKGGERGGEGVGGLSVCRVRGACNDFIREQSQVEDKEYVLQPYIGALKRQHG